MTDNLQTLLVQGEPMGGATTPAAPTTAEPVAPATPSATPTDAEAQLAEYKRQVAKYEADVRALKSASDKRLHDAETTWKQQQSQMQKELQAIRMASMDDDERKLYETSLAQEQQQEIAQQLEESRRSAQEYQANLQAIQYFIGLGVPADKLVIDQGYDTLFNSGMGWMTDELKRSRTAPASPPAQPGQFPLPNPPVVATTNQGLPNTKPTWDDLRKKYGSDEQIYRLVEAGLLPGDIVPS
jgi:hypothetical protein